MLDGRPNEFSKYVDRRPRRNERRDSGIEKERSPTEKLRISPLWGGEGEETRCEGIIFGFVIWSPAFKLWACQSGRLRLSGPRGKRGLRLSWRWMGLGSHPFRRGLRFLIIC